jgi:hypothetical protein
MWLMVPWWQLDEDDDRPDEVWVEGDDPLHETDEEVDEPW